MIEYEFKDRIVNQFDFRISVVSDINNRKSDNQANDPFAPSNVVSPYEYTHISSSFIFSKAPKQDRLSYLDTPEDSLMDTRQTYLQLHRQEIHKLKEKELVKRNTTLLDVVSCQTQ